ncbi:protein odr-4 homolog isoform X2 [Ricinus communis]|uniref:Zinc binding dehydrogenase, putative n=1 Tax=Ricinus communis TaxID=3988 RepID=B9SMX2_RICCO|nr:protein odr-4 homolog isoform X2 [Ricinus communis]EEF35013.1 zinc binding dehydrogenase, putative [Ricinus communis]|eukprot:XP_002527341.1 protein odr-4 homolog isoform X2 [Ricinus communis]
MVKAVVGDETQLNLVQNRLSQSGLTSQVGLVIGKLSSALDRGFVYDLVPTPSNDAGEPACSIIDTFKDDKKKGSSKSKSQIADSSTLAIDKDWVSEHARQVSRMLLGGMKVIGIYVWVSDASFKNSTITLSQTVKGVAEAAPISATDWDERLLIHICYSPMRWTCRNCVLASNITASSIRPCDFKMGRVLSSLRTFRCTYNFELSLPICRENASNSSMLSAILHHGISIHAKVLNSARALIDGNLVVNEESSVTEGLHEVELLLPFMKNTLGEACSNKDVIGVLMFSGSVCSFAYSNSKESISQAVADIKDDIIRSLQSRLDIICDQADEDLGPMDNDVQDASQGKTPEKPVSRLVLRLLRDTCSLAFPRRVFIPWSGGTFICDYLQPSERLEVLKDHCVELMSMEVPTDTSTILQPEAEAPSLIAKSFWDVAVPGQPASTSSLEKSKKMNTNGVVGGGKSAKSFNFNILAAVFFLLLSILVGFILVGQS